MQNPEPDNWHQKSSYRKKVLATPASLGKRNLIQKVEIKPGKTVSRHYHNQTTEIFYILQDGGTLTIDGTTVTPEQGDLIICEPEDVHSVTNQSDQVFRILVFKTDLHDNDTVWLDNE